MKLNNLEVKKAVYYAMWDNVNVKYNKGWDGYTLEASNTASIEDLKITENILCDIDLGEYDFSKRVDQTTYTAFSFFSSNDTTNHMDEWVEANEEKLFDDAKRVQTIKKLIDEVFEDIRNRFEWLTQQDDNEAIIDWKECGLKDFYTDEMNRYCQEYSEHGGE